MTQSDPLIFHVDPEHAGLRRAVVLFLLLALIVSFLLLRGLLGWLLPRASVPGVLACLGAFPLGLFLAWLVENGLKRTWRSGRRLMLAGKQVRLQQPEGPEELIAIDEPFQQLWWSFPLSGYRRGGRELRIPADWRCMAGQLYQGETRIVPFCFVPPEQAEAWDALYEFELLNPGDVYEKSLESRLGGPSRPELPAEVVAGKQGRYWLAERHRWRQGVELTPEDFRRFMEQVRPAPTG